MNQNAPFCWCFIGAGRLANTVAETISRSGRHTVASVYTRRPEQCRAFAGKYGARPASSAEEAISSPGVDGVYIVTPHNSHYEYAKLALTLGKPVLCEKPFTVSAQQAEELIALAKEKQLYLAEAMWTWFAPTAHQIKAWLDGGEFGEIESVSISYYPKNHHCSKRCTDPALAGGALLDIGVYPITYLYRLFGNPVQTVCKGTLQGGVDLGEDVEMTFANRQTYTATVSMTDFKKFEKLSIRGSKASVNLLLYHAAGGAKLVRRSGKNETFRGSGGYLNEFDVVASEIREGLAESRFVPHRATLDVMRILDDCRRQMDLVYPFER